MSIKLKLPLIGSIVKVLIMLLSKYSLSRLVKMVAIEAGGGKKMSMTVSIISITPNSPIMPDGAPPDCLVSVDVSAGVEVPSIFSSSSSHDLLEQNRRVVLSVGGSVGGASLAARAVSLVARSGGISSGHTLNVL